MKVPHLLRRAAVAGAVLAVSASGLAAAASTPESGNDSGDYSPVTASAAQHEGQGGHLPETRENISLVSKLELKGRFGNVVPEQIADVAVHKGFAYLNSWDEASCSRGGTYVVDIRNPREPKEIAFVAAPAKSYHGEGAHVVTFNGRDILAVNNEPCSYHQPSPANPAGPGGFDLIDVTDPFNPVKLGVPGAPTGGDTGPDDGSLVGGEVPHSNHSTFMWEHANKLYLVTVDNLEIYDVDIFDITKPETPLPVAEYDLLELFPQIADQGNIGSFAGTFHHDSVVKMIGGKPIALTGYWDGGYVTYDLSDPFAPQYIGDSSFAGADPLTGLPFPEGNAHYGEFSHDNKFVLGADEDFTTHRGGVFRITTGDNTGEYPSTGVGGGAPAATLPDRVMNGPTVYGGYGCDASDDIPLRSAYNFALEPGEEAILVLQRGPAYDSDEDYDGDGDINNDADDACFPGDKAENAWDAGWRNILLINRHTATDPDGPGPQPPVANGQAGDSAACGSGGYTAGKVPVTVCTTHEAGHLIFDDAPTYGIPYDGDGAEMAPIGAEGEKVQATSQFDGWGYGHLYRNNAGKLERVDSWAVDEALDERFSSGFGDLSIHEFAADPTENLAYTAYYSAGARVISFGDDGISEVGSFIDSGGNNFWGVEQFTHGDERLMALSDRDYGLYILKYTGSLAAAPPQCEDQTWATGTNRPVTIPLACSDRNGNTLTLSIVGSPANGTLSPLDGNRVTYTPRNGFNGQDAFTYRAFDGSMFSNTATITLLVGKCSNRLNSTNGLDSLVGTVLGDSVSLGAGNDIVHLAQGNDCGLGEAGNDQLHGGSDADELGGGDGRDRVFGDSGADVLRGNAGVDHLRGSSGNDRVRGDAGNDFVSGGSNHDVVYGGSGRDAMVGDAGNDRLLGGSGNDTIDVGKGSNRVWAGPGKDKVEAVNRRRDLIRCGKGRDVVRADLVDRVARDCEVVTRPRVTRNK